MTLGELIEALTAELGLDLSSDSTDAERRVFVADYSITRARGLVGVELDQDGDLVLEFQP